MKNSDWVLIGHVGVDAGLLTIGDPCYFSGIDYDRDILPTVLGGYDRHENYWDIDFSGGMIVFSTTWGDGIYPVYAKLGANGRPTEVKVVMDDYDNEEYDNVDCSIDDPCEECQRGLGYTGNQEYYRDEDEGNYR